MSEKLQKVLAAQGLGGRRTMEQWIEAGVCWLTASQLRSGFE